MGQGGQEARSKVIQIGAEVDAAQSPAERARAVSQGARLLTRKNDPSLSASVLNKALNDIDGATFTGKGDRPKVKMLLAKLEFDIKQAVEEAMANCERGRTPAPARYAKARKLQHARPRVRNRGDDTRQPLFPTNAVPTAALTGALRPGRLPIFLRPPPLHRC